MLTTQKDYNHTPNNNTKHTKLKPLGKVLLASAFALSVANAQPEAQNEAQAPANANAQEATKEATQEATNQSTQEVASEATNEASQAQTPNQKEPVQSTSTPCGEGCGVPHTHTHKKAQTR